MFDKKDCSINIKFVNFLYEKLVISSRFCLKFSLIPTTLLILIPVLIAVLKHTFPSRTRLLRGPAAMILHIWVWESSSTPDFFLPWCCTIRVWPEEKHNSPWNTGAYGCGKDAEMPVEWRFFFEKFSWSFASWHAVRAVRIVRSGWIVRIVWVKFAENFDLSCHHFTVCGCFFPSALVRTTLVLWRMEVPPEKNRGWKAPLPGQVNDLYLAEIAHRNFLSAWRPPVSRWNGEEVSAGKMLKCRWNGDFFWKIFRLYVSSFCYSASAFPWTIMKKPLYF